MKDSLPSYLFHQGTNCRAYEYMGVHRIGDRTVFRVWAPNAAEVAVCGSFCSWDPSAASAMSRITEGGIWELVTDGLPDGTSYKYLITASDGRKFWKSDPYAAAMEAPPEAASVICPYPTDHVWHDAAWMSGRRDARDYSGPMNIFELHAGSFMRHPDGTLLPWRELAGELAPYVKAMGYTHIELMPVAEHPFDGSWGYQVGGFYAPTSRFGTPDDFCSFIDSMHTAGIGVILDWVPAHFPKDEFGLYEFDGKPLYEYQGKDRMEHAGWGTRCFDVGRNEVQCFLISNAVCLADIYHADGLRVDAVASMLYLDYDREPGEWIPNVYGDNRNLEAIAFFGKLNSYMKDNFPGVMMIAEESSAWGGVTGDPPHGLGFTHKWNMGWMNDALSYKSEDPLFRKYRHDKLTFPLCYSFSEKYVLPVSHDEVVHGKKSLLDRSPLGYDDKFADTRAFLVWMMTFPGKKLSFMGNEIGQFAEWKYDSSVEYFLTGYDRHRQLQKFTADLNGLYLSSPELWERDGGWDGFEWTDADNAENSVVSFIRKSSRGEYLTVINFSSRDYAEYRVGVPYRDCRCELLISSDDVRYGGVGRLPENVIRSAGIPAGRCENSVRTVLPPFSGQIFRIKKKKSGKNKNDAGKKENGTLSKRIKQEKTTE
ncbi:MAG: 1,4-alpha-glucan branching protein GlgB [Clostridia bacterium]|nr:1,4-alpha-glucan branching protein GlgB [Clostridia bacterium]